MRFSKISFTIKTQVVEKTIFQSLAPMFILVPIEARHQQFSNIVYRWKKTNFCILPNVGPKHLMMKCLATIWSVLTLAFHWLSKNMVDIKLVIIHKQSLKLSGWSHDLLKRRPVCTLPILILVFLDKT